MRIPWILVVVITTANVREACCDEWMPADATETEQIKSAVVRLNDPNFEQREAAVDELFGMGRNAVWALRVAATSSVSETSVRAFDVMQRLYRGTDEPTFEAVEQAFRQLKHADNLAVAARAERAFENGAETRQNRAIDQFERLGGIIHYAERRGEAQPFGRPRIENIVLGYDWVGGDAGLELLGRIDDIRNARTALYIIRPAEVSNEAKINLMAELPFMEITYRGPARMGIKSNAFRNNEEGCIISEVEADSAAERAGLRKNDQVVEIAGETVESFSDLIAIIQKKEPGDRVSIVYRRGSETSVAIAELLPWPSAKFPRPRP